MLAKLHSDNKTKQVKEITKDNQVEILKGKQVSKQIADVAYAANPTEADKITSQPLIKQETLANDVHQYTEKSIKNQTQSTAQT